MNRTEDLTRVGWCRVHQGEFSPGGHYDRERLVSVGICENCDYWMDRFKDREDPDVAIVNGHFYRIGNPTDNPKGMGGVGTKIKFFDGREVFTDSLWSNGDIPIDWQGWLYDNATMEFVNERA